ncbi:hypothetical protein RHODGE_RHODGE_02875 [Rhodoplanes serenus]|uniref:Glycoside hydrolase family 5 domain-containing protein n=1 Tax=Rhodoplanes serenus TaxID=200615 RepID=A0A3S4B5J4_9BRAD|nr:hypothetical protein [Rhodoplanes serenus]VCU09706.1 hypothetical protein RHODGE_RHODGE_02875 [Rhodoplanes serenus]
MTAALAAALALIPAAPLVSRVPVQAQPAGRAGGDLGAVPLRWRVGGGNLVTHLAGAESRQLYTALTGIGARLGRMDSYGWRDLARRPTPQDFEAAMREAHRNGIVPIILLEYEGSYQFLDPPQPIGSYDDWYAAGRVHAERFRPDGTFWREHGIRGFGVTVYTAINEPDVQATIPHAAYRDALAGFADGVHSIDPALRVVPGGFATCNSHGDAMLRGYGPAIADLLESGRLDGIDLHTYYNARWFPLTRGRTVSAQGCFDRVKAALGLRRDIAFYATEFNVAQVEDWADPRLAASLFLTGLWDHLGVVRADRRSSATVLAFPWNLADTGRIEGPAYAMAAAEDPWRPDLRAEALRLVLDLAGDMRFTALDPDRSGTYRLEGDDGMLLVWQNRPGWTDRPGPTWTVELPGWARMAELWGFDGLRRVVPVHGGMNELAGLAENETHMVRLRRTEEQREQGSRR